MHPSSQDRPFRTVFVGWIVPWLKATGYTIYPLRGFKMAEVMNNPCVHLSWDPESRILNLYFKESLRI